MAEHTAGIGGPLHQTRALCIRTVHLANRTFVEVDVAAAAAVGVVAVAADVVATAGRLQTVVSQHTTLYSSHLPDSLLRSAQHVEHSDPTWALVADSAPT